MKRRAAAVVALAAVWLATTGGRVGSDQLFIFRAEEARQQRIERRAADALKDEFPELSAAPRSAMSRTAMRATLERLLSRATLADPRRPTMLVAAHFLAVRLESTDPPSQEELDRSIGAPPERVDVVAGHRLHYVWAGLGARWVSDWGLLRTVWHDHPETPWGEAAFVELLARGWRDDVLCRAGPDEFRDVIREGEQFLARYPRSGVRREVVTNLAWAYETWWSLSRSTTDAHVADPRAYAVGADEARQKAIARYEEALRLGLSATIGRDARARLATLKRGVDTNQRVFHCVYD